MELEPGDDYLSRIATFIRANEKKLAESGLIRRRRARQPPPTTGSVLNPLTWFGSETMAGDAPTVKPIVLSLSTHRLFYILMRLEGIGIDIGTLDVKIDSPSRPMSYVNLFASDKSDAGSLASFRSSLSAVSRLSLGGGWWGRPEPPSIDNELKYIYSSFTKLPALSITAPGRKHIKEIADDPPNENALPLDAFKNLLLLECVDIDPRTLLGWDRLAESLRSLTIKKSGLEDFADVFIGAVIDDQARREGSTSRSRRRRIPRRTAKQPSYYNSTRLPESVPEGSETTEEENTTSPPSPPPSTELSSLKWAFLKHLSLCDNALTFLSTEILPLLTQLTHLDLSSNLLVSVPPGLSSLINLISLNLSDNMIDSVLGISTNLGQVLSINLSHNRLESICGLERVLALERVDLRHNVLEDVAEISRLATLPHIADVCVLGNPFTDVDDSYRSTCFDYFWKEGKGVTLDGVAPTFIEKRNLTVPPPPQMSSSRSNIVTNSPPVVAVGHNPHHHHHRRAPSTESPPSSSNASPHLKPRRKKITRIVDLDGGETPAPSHRRAMSDGGSSSARPKWGQFGFKEDDKASAVSDPPATQGTSAAGAADGSSTHKSETADAPPAPLKPRFTSATVSRRGMRHSRYQTEFTPSGASFTPESNSKPDATSISTYNKQVPINTPPSDTLSSLRRIRQGSATFSSKSAMRRARVSASVYEPPSSSSGADDGQSSAEAYRRKLEALRSDMGDGWLKVLSQSQMGSAGVASS